MSRTLHLILLVMFLTSLVACSGSTVAPSQVRYEVIGEGIGVTANSFSEIKMPVSLTYRNATGGTEQNNALTPWQLRFEGRKGQPLYVSAQNGTASGRVTCRIVVNEQVVQSATSDARYGIATCSGNL